jgi:hypothetical protein
MQIPTGGGSASRESLSKRSPSHLDSFSPPPCLPARREAKQLAARRAATRRCNIPSSLVKQPYSFPRRDCARVVKRYPPRGVGGAPTGAFGLSRLRGATRTLRSVRSPLGAPPWRFLAGGRASVCDISFATRAASSSQPSRSAWRAGSRTSRARLRAAAAGHHTSLRLWTVSGRRPSMSEASESYRRCVS